MATISGTSGSDTLNGTSANDTLNGLGGNDVLVASGGTDFYDGGAGSDTLDLRATTAGITLSFASGTISGAFNGTFANIERVLGGNGADSLFGAAGNQNLSARGGDDTLAGGVGVDTLWGGIGADRFFFRDTGVANADSVADFASGSDKIVLDASVMTALGANGNFAASDARFAANATGVAQDADDRVIFNTSTGQVFYDADGTGSGAAVLLATLQTGATLAATDIVVEGASSGMHRTGTSGDDTLVGGDGNDTLEGLAGNDALFGGAGNDLLDGGPGIDTLDGGTGDDTYNITSWNANPYETLVDASGVDTVVVSHGLAGFNLDADFENLTIIDSGGGFTGHGNDLDNILDGSEAGSQILLFGHGGNDLILGAELRDTLGGGAGDDTIRGAGGGDSIEGEAGNDLLEAGGSGAFGIGGGIGNDTIIGGSGSDRLDGGAGNDVLTGGAGADLYAFSVVAGAANADTITDFGSAEPGGDRIQLDGNVHTDVGPWGNFEQNDGRFHAAPGATSGHDGDDRVVYNTSTGQLFYDADGSGSGAALLFATLQGAPTMVASDFTVVNGSGRAFVGTDGDDTLEGTPSNDTLEGLGGNDSLTGRDSADLLIGGDGSDTLMGGFGKGEAIRDYFADTLDGGLGDDVYYVNDFEDFILPDPGGVDTVVIDVGHWTLGEGLDNLEVFEGGGVGNELDNVMTGGHHFEGMGGNDLLITAFPGVEGSTSARGGDGNDTLFGGGLTTSLFGDAGDDVLQPGTEPFWGEANELTGGAGADSFVFTQTGFTENLILDFTSGNDEIVLDGNAHMNIGASGRFGSNDARFAANSTGAAQDASDRVIYNTSTGELWYDADGSGSGAAALIATLQDAPAVLASDIEVFNGSTPGESIQGTPGDDNLTGTAGDDTVDGLGGNDTIAGAGGQDLLIGGAGNDHLFGNVNTDRDTLDGGTGDDTYHIDFFDGTPQNVVLVDAGGVDTVIAASWTLGDGFENLTLRGDSGGGSGNALDNVIRDESSLGSSFLGGNEGNDTLIGGAGGNRIFGDAGNDLLAGGGGALDSLTGGDGADTFLFDTSATAEGSGRIADFASSLDTIRLDATVMPALGTSGRFTTGDGRFAANSTGSAQDSSDRVIYDTSTAELWYDGDGSGGGAAGLIAVLLGAPLLAASDIEVVNGTAPGNVINGTAANDTLTGTAGDDTINGFDGNDLFLAGSTGGNDAINGGAGRDSIEFKERATSAITVDFVAGTITGGSSGTIGFTSIERVLTGNFNDTLSGNGAAQTLTGQGGSDTIWGAGGADTLWGGTGADAFVFREMGTANADRVSDFASGSEKLHLDDAAFTSIGAMGNFAAADARFKANSSGTATDTNDRVVFNTSTGQLYYDADGSGSGAAPQLIATVQAGATVAATDIVVI
jgi:Ca2+-binding RTX toxin-like protein